LSAIRSRWSDQRPEVLTLVVTAAMFYVAGLIVVRAFRDPWPP
jgi:hypothetical protein